MSLPAHKPPKPVNLTDALHEARAVSGGSSRPPPPSHSAALAAKTILIVDDDPSVRAMLVKALSSRYVVYEAADGLAAAELAGKIAQPSLVVCDVVMPRMDGFQLASILKSHPVLKNVPIMFLSSRNGPADVLRGIGLGAKQYVAKPFNLPDLVEKITRIVG